MRVVFDGTSVVLSYTAGNTSSQTFRPERYPTARYVTAEVPETLDADPRTGLAGPPAEECSAEDPEPEETAAKETATLSVEECSAEVPGPEEPAAEAPGPEGLAAPPATECSAEAPEPEETAARPVEEADARVPAAEATATLPVEECSAEDPEP